MRWSLQHEGVAEPTLVADEAGRAGVAGADRFDGGLAGVHAAGHREVDAFQPDASGKAQRGGVAGDEHAVGGHLRHHLQPGLGNQVRAVLLQLAVLHQRCDGRVLLQRGDDLLGPLLLRAQLVELQHDADRDGVEVGVEEAAAVDTAGGADDLDVDALAAAHAEALVDHFLGQRQRLLHAEREVLRVACARRGRPPWRGSC